PLRLRRRRLPVHHVREHDQRAQPRRQLAERQRDRPVARSPVSPLVLRLHRIENAIAAAPALLAEAADPAGKQRRHAAAAAAPRAETPAVPERLACLGSARSRAAAASIPIATAAVALAEGLEQLLVGRLRGLHEPTDVRVPDDRLVPSAERARPARRPARALALR